MNKITANTIIHHNDTIKRGTPTSFKSGFAHQAQDCLVHGMKKLEKGGFLLEFLIVDFCGLILPRTYQAFNRNKEELGHLNYKAGVEEFLREILSGPSMVIIPMLALKAASKVLNPSVYIPVKNYNALSEVYKSTIEKMDTKIPLVKDVKTNFVNQLFNKIFEVHKNVNLDDDRKVFTEIFDRLITGQKYDSKIKGFVDITSKDKANAVNNLTNHIAKMNEKLGLRKNIQNVKIADGLDVNISNLAEDVVNFANGTIRKVNGIITRSRVENGTIYKDKKNLKELITQIGEIQTGTRKAAVVLGIAAVAGFLYITPKIYQRYKKYPGIEGLSTESANNKKAGTN
jgi:hypothetical protein